MNNAVTVEQMKALDKRAIDELGISSLILMENAGRDISNEVRRLLKKRNAKHICVVCGTGNNGGDGFVAARHLLNADIDVRTYLIGEASQLSPDANTNFQILINCGFEVKELNGLRDTEIEEIQHADIVIDAIFGVGLNREIEEPIKTVIETINKEANRIISVDVPSGLNATTGETYGACISASRTVTFSFAKTGFYENEGPTHTGKILVREIGIPKKVLDQIV